MGEEPPKKRRRGGTRRKTGCYTCKARHARCDEKKPICSNCERLNLDCKQPDPFAPSEWTTVFEVSTPSSTINNEAPPPSDVSASQPSSTWDVFRPRIRGLDQTRDGSSPNDILSSLNFITPISIDTTSTVETVSITSETAFLLQTYVRSVAQWMDLMDHRNTYQLKIPRLTLTSPLLFHCLCAFTAKHLALSNLSHNPSWDSTASDHYGRALQLLIHALNTPSHEHALTATILLSSYEIVARLGSEYHRRHFLGLTMLVKSLGVNAQSTGIDRANFWIYVRHEIGLSLATERPLVLDPLEWNVAWEEGEIAEDVLGNRVLWILARVCNLVFSPEGGTAASKQKRQDFLLELQEWKASLSDIFIGIPYGDEDEEGFKKVYFTVTAAAAAAFWYHITHILLYAEPTLQDPGHIPLIQDQAMRLTNIALSDFPDALKVFSTHGLYYAAKHISGISRKARIWNILNEVETQTGYHTRSVVKRLQALVEDQGR